jgi:hypothetical protein
MKFSMIELKAKSNSEDNYKTAIDDTMAVELSDLMNLCCRISFIINSFNNRYNYVKAQFILLRKIQQSHRYVCQEI